jgi:hypothetical protein
VFQTLSLLSRVFLAIHNSLDASDLLPSALLRTFKV